MEWISVNIPFAGVSVYKKVYPTLRVIIYLPNYIINLHRKGEECLSEEKKCLSGEEKCLRMRGEFFESGYELPGMGHNIPGMKNAFPSNNNVIPSSENARGSIREY